MRKYDVIMLKKGKGVLYKDLILEKAIKLMESKTLKSTAVTKDGFGREVEFTLSELKEL